MDPLLIIALSSLIHLSQSLLLQQLLDNYKLIKKISLTTGKYQSLQFSKILSLGLCLTSTVMYVQFTKSNQGKCIQACLIDVKHISMYVLPINKDISIPTYQWLSGLSFVFGQQNVLHCEELPHYLKKINATLIIKE